MPENIAQVAAIMQAEIMDATVGSILINGWFDSHIKLTGTRRAVGTLFGRELDAEMDGGAFVGDSTNDRLMFGAF